LTCQAEKGGIVLPAILVSATLVGVMLIAIVLLIALFIISSVVGIYNNLVRLRNALERSFANIDVLLKQRHDELPKLIETCKGYMQYEQKTLQSVTEARSAYARAASPQEKAQADNLISGALRGLFAVAESYPDLKANTNFIQLQSRITGLEEKIAAQRARYNDDVNSFNIRIAQVPASFIAGFMHLEAHPLFQAGEAEREDVQVKFT
jgi:LemA protein